MSDIRFFQVGGCVRDGILGIKTKDIDFAVEAPSFEDMQLAVHARCSKVFLESPEFLTIRGLDPDLGAVDFVLCRKDGPSTDGRRPDFVEPGTIFDDLARRDFTINAIALTDDGELLDPHDGMTDIGLKVLRFVGKPSDRLREDALRAFRGIRFRITKGFDLHPETKEAIEDMRPSDFTGVSTDRIRDELMRCFSHDTNDTLRVLVHQFPVLLRLAIDRGIWLKPTTEKP